MSSAELWFKAYEWQSLYLIPSVYSIQLFEYKLAITWGFFLHFDIAYYRVPSNFSHTVVDGDPHSARFTWSPPPEQEHSGEITHYTIICTSESGGEEITVSQTGLETTISSFTPGTHYLCSIFASTTCHGEGPYSDAIELLTSMFVSICTILV